MLRFWPVIWIKLPLIEVYYLVIHRHTTNVNYSWFWCISLFDSYYERYTFTLSARSPGISEILSLSQVEEITGDELLMYLLYTFMIEINQIDDFFDGGQRDFPMDHIIDWWNFQVNITCIFRSFDPAVDQHFLCQCKGKIQTDRKVVRYVIHTDRDHSGSDQTVLNDSGVIALLGRRCATDRVRTFHRLWV